MTLKNKIYQTQTSMTIPSLVLSWLVLLFLLPDSVSAKFVSFKKIIIEDVIIGQKSCEEHASRSIQIIASLQGGNENIDDKFALSYSIDNGDTWQDENLFENLIAGEYIILVNSKNNFSDPISISLNGPLTAWIEEITPSGCGSSANGSVTIGISGGTSPYQLYNNEIESQEEQTFARLEAGFYTIKVEDAAGCQVDIEVEILSSPLPIEISCPSFGTIQACSPAEVLREQLDLWFFPFYENEKKYTSVTYDIDINGVVISGIQDLGEVTYTDHVGGYMTVTCYIDCDGSQETCSATLFALEPALPVCSVPAELYTSSCDDLEENFIAWLETFNVDSGCGGEIQYAVTRSNGVIAHYADIMEIPAPFFCGESVEVEVQIASDLGVSVNCHSKFTSLNFLPTSHGSGLLGPTTICKGIEGNIYSVSDQWAGQQINWTYSGKGMIIIDQEQGVVDIGFSSNASEGYLMAEVVLGGIKDSIFVSFASPSYCKINCPENLSITSFMLEDPGLGRARSYQARDILLITGSIGPSNDIELSGGLGIEIKPGFSIANSAKIHTQIKTCQNAEN